MKWLAKAPVQGVAVVIVASRQRRRRMSTRPTATMAGTTVEQVAVASSQRKARTAATTIARQVAAGRVARRMHCSVRTCAALPRTRDCRTPAAAAARRLHKWLDCSGAARLISDARVTVRHCLSPQLPAAAPTRGVRGSPRAAVSAARTFAEVHWCRVPLAALPRTRACQTPAAAAAHRLHIRWRRNGAALLTCDARGCVTVRHRPPPQLPAAAPTRGVRTSP